MKPYILAILVYTLYIIAYRYITKITDKLIRVPLSAVKTLNGIVRGLNMVVCGLRLAGYTARRLQLI